MLTHALRTARRTLRRGFTLIELLAVILIVSILMMFLLPKIPEAIDAAEVTACKANLSEIYKGFLLFKTSLNRAPNESGVRFFAELVSSDTFENTKTSASKLTCPGVDKGSLTGVAGKPETEWYGKLDGLDGSCSAYAGRNSKDFPLRKFPGSGKDALVSDDNDPEMNHRHTTCVLFADGSVQTYELSELKKQGLIGEDEKVLQVGPDSPIEELRKLSLD